MMAYMFGPMPYDFISCSDDLRLCLAGRSLTCPGFNFLFTSLLTSFSERSVANAHRNHPSMPAWMDQSMQSCTLELYYVKATPDLFGASFTHLSMCSMHVSASFIFGVVCIQEQKQLFLPNPINLVISEEHILAVLAADQESAMTLAAQMSMILAALHESADEHEALNSILSVEGAGSILRSLDQQRLSDFTIILKEMHANFKHEDHSRPATPTRPSSPVASQNLRKRGSLAVAVDAALFTIYSRTSPTPPSPQLRPRTVRSNTFNSAVGDSFMPLSRRSSVSGHELSRSATAGHEISPSSPASRAVSSYMKPSDSPLMKAWTPTADDINSVLPLSRKGSSKHDGYATRERRDSNSSAGMSSVARSGLAQVWL